MSRPALAAAALLIPAVFPTAAVAQGPYLSPSPYFAPGPGVPFGVPLRVPDAPPPHGWGRVPGPDAAPFFPPATARGGWYATPPRSPFPSGVVSGHGSYGRGPLAAPVVPPPFVNGAGPSQSTLYQPTPQAPPVRLEPVGKEVTVGRVTARRYDYSFEAVPLADPASAPGPAFAPGGAPGGWD